MSKKSLIFTLLFVLAIGAGFAIWRVQEARAKAEKIEAEIVKKLTAEEINLILKSQAASDDGSISGIVQTVETRQVFLKGLREYLTLAAQARREGLTEDGSFKINFEYKKNLLLADLYKAKLSKEQEKYYAVPKEQLDAVWKIEANEKQFALDMETMQSIQKAVAKERGDQFSASRLQGESLIKARETWARIKILSDTAKSDAEFIAGPEIGLRIKILEAGILSADYLRKNWANNIKADQAEIAEFVKNHPEYDVAKKRETAETVLRRVNAGEDFAKLATEFSEDRISKIKGGLYENIEKDALWIEVENAALALENGQIANRLIETHTGFHIVKLENKQIKKDATGKESVVYNVRHILLQKNFEDPANKNPEIPSPFLKAEEIAKAEIEKEKRNKFVENVSRINPIVLPEDFTVDLPSKGAANLPKS